MDPKGRWPLKHLALIKAALEANIKRMKLLAYFQKYFPYVIIEYTTRNGRPPTDNAFSMRVREIIKSERANYEEHMEWAREQISMTNYSPYMV
jgi:hypothetical protein